MSKTSGRRETRAEVRNASLRQTATPVHDETRPVITIKGKPGNVSAFEIGIKYLSFEELAEVANPSQFYLSLESDLGVEQDWQKQVASLNGLRSILKFNTKIVEESPLTLLIFKKVCLLVTNMKSAIAKLSLLCLQEGIPRIAPILPKLSTILLQQLFAKLADCNSFLLAEVEKSLDSFYSHCQPSRVLACLITFADHKNPNVRCHIARGFGRSFERMCKDVFLFKDYDKITRLLAALVKDPSAEVRQCTKDCIKQLADLSDQPELVLKAIQQQGGNVPAIGKSMLADSNLKDDGASKRVERKVGINLRRIASNKITNLNRTEELLKDMPPVGIQIRSNKQQSVVKEEDDGDDMVAKKALPLMQRKKKAPQLTRSYPELEVLNEILLDLEKEGKGF